ncbi:MAG: hypothetical protein BAJATHORv1_10102 [Candidatus Thorarchaeota archaeon]|nr:MAG: hypothetical protein BAJATHORv1_10102 [Candidatus Thorarchaeota archaeon]
MPIVEIITSLEAPLYCDSFYFFSPELIGAHIENNQTTYNSHITICITSSNWVCNWIFCVE